MKPNFALTLSFEGIGLLHRTPAGWHLVGDVALDTPDLAGALAGLAGKARSLDPTGLRSKVVIPNDQIKYLSFESDSRDVDILDAQVRGALNGATPYALSELAYDWSVTDGMVYVAAVARETLVEAETFAADHAFNPLCFVSIPEAGRFLGEPFFGETAHAGKVLGPDETVLRDDDAIRVVGRARLPDPEPTPEPIAPPEPKPAPQADTKPDPAPEPAPTFKAAPRTEPPVAKTPEPPKPAPPKPEQKPAAPPAAPPRAEAREAAPVAFSSIRRDPAAPADQDRNTPSRAVPDLPKARFTPPAQQPEPKAEPAPPAAKPTPASVKGAADGALPMDEEAARRGATLRVAPPPGPPQDDRLIPDPDAPVAEPIADPPRASGMAFLSRRKPGAPARERPAKRGGGGKAWSLPIDKIRPPTLPWPGKKAKPALDPRAEAKAEAQRIAAQKWAAERERMTVFGARSTDGTAAEKPRYLALILTAILLLFLVAVAAWAALFLDDGVSGLFRSSDDVQIAEEAEPDLPETTRAGDQPALIQPADEPMDPDRQAALSPDLQNDPEAAADEPLETLDVLRSPVSEGLTPDEARARYAATGIWQVAPDPSATPSATSLEEVYQTSLDPDLDFGDAIALPEADNLRTDARPPTPADPPPPGADFERDERGFIAATPEGAETPEGILIFAGRPPIVPPQTPERAAPEQVEGTANAAPREATVRPRLRPDDLSDLFERSNNGGRTLAELSDIRPRLRPKSAQELAIEAAVAEAGADATEDSGDPLAGATQQAVAASLKPRARPAGFATIVEASREVAAAEPVSAEQVVAVSIPTTASVARAATEKNQISLRRVNLIGVYGKPNSRRALVRLANGRYQKVQVGDRLDGGQVTAIGEDELRYTKGGRSVALKMPKG